MSSVDRSKCTFCRIYDDKEDTTNLFKVIFVNIFSYCGFNSEITRLKTRINIAE